MHAWQIARKGIGLNGIELGFISLFRLISAHKCHLAGHPRQTNRNDRQQTEETDMCTGTGLGGTPDSLQGLGVP